MADTEKVEKKEEVETVEEKVELDGETVKIISDNVSEGLEEKMSSMAQAAAEKAAEAVAVKMESVTKKNIADIDDKDKADKLPANLGTIKVKTFDRGDGKVEEIEVESKFAHESKEMRFLKAARALAFGDYNTLQAYREDALAVRKTCGYGSTATDENGGYLVPYPDFETTVHENLPKYGVAATYVTTRTVTGNEVKQIGINTELTFVETAEAGVKSAGKLDINSENRKLVKYALIIPATDELTEDSAIDYWALITREMARAYAKLQDQIVFTHLTMGIAHTTGVITEPVAGAGGTINWTDLLNAENAIEDGINTSGYKWYMRREVWNILVNLVGVTNDHYLSGSLNTMRGWTPNNNDPTTPWGTPIVYTRVLDTSVTVPNPGTMCVYGDLSYYTLYQKRGMVVTALREASIVDSESETINLATQDVTALRFVVRLFGLLNSNDASRFVILGVGTVS